MTSLIRNLFSACVLIVVAGLGAGPALSQPAATDGPAVRVAMTPAPLVTPPLAEPAALLCGKVWVDTNYVVPRNCMRACLNAHHPLGECRTKLVPLCLSCWRELVVCARERIGPPALHCKVCTERYANCMRPFFL